MLNQSIEETTANVVTSTRQFLRSGSRLCEERDASNVVVKMNFSLGQRVNTTNYFYSVDQLGSVRDVTDGTATIAARYEYNSFGQPVKTIGVFDSDFQYASYFTHARSGLNLTVYRSYNPYLGRWLSRDPLEEDEGTNMFCYVDNNPIGSFDPLGLASQSACCGGAPPPPPPPPPEDEKKPEDPCDEVRMKIAEVMRFLRKKKKAQEKDKRQIPDKKCERKRKADGTKVGHEDAMWDRRANLVKLIWKWNGLNCGELPPGAEDATKNPDGSVPKPKRGFK